MAPDTFGLYEIDEDAYPLLMAWEARVRRRQSFYGGHIRPDADFMVAHGPAYGEDRWEEHTGYSPSTIAAEIAGLAAAAHLAQAAGDSARALLLPGDRRRLPAQRQDLDRDQHRPVRRHRYFIRLSPTGDPNAAETYNLNNGSLEQRRSAEGGGRGLPRADPAR